MEALQLGPHVTCPVQAPRSEAARPPPRTSAALPSNLQGGVPSRPVTRLACSVPPVPGLPLSSKRCPASATLLRSCFSGQQGNRIETYSDRAFRAVAESSSCCGALETAGLSTLVTAAAFCGSSLGASSQRGISPWVCASDACSASKRPRCCVVSHRGGGKGGIGPLVGTQELPRTLPPSVQRRAVCGQPGVTWHCHWRPVADADPGALQRGCTASVHRTRCSRRSRWHTKTRPTGSASSSSSAVHQSATGARQVSSVGSFPWSCGDGSSSSARRGSLAASQAFTASLGHCSPADIEPPEGHANGAPPLRRHPVPHSRSKPPLQQQQQQQQREQGQERYGGSGQEVQWEEGQQEGGVWEAERVGMKCVGPGPGQQELVLGLGGLEHEDEAGVESRMEVGLLGITECDDGSRLFRFGPAEHNGALPLSVQQHPPSAAEGSSSEDSSEDSTTSSSSNSNSSSSSSDGSGSSMEQVTGFVVNGSANVSIRAELDEEYSREAQRKQQEAMGKEGEDMDVGWGDDEVYSEVDDREEGTREEGKEEEEEGGVPQEPTQMKHEIRQLRLEVGVASVPHPARASRGGEDAHLVEANWLGVADGISTWAEQGVNSGLFSRELLWNCVDVIRSSWELLGVCPHPKAIIEESHSRTDLRGSCTITLAVIEGQMLKVANIGDSGFVLLRVEDQLLQSERMEHDFNDPFQIGCNVGDDPSCAMLYEAAVRPGDILLLATDGLFDNVFMDEIVTELRTGAAEGKDPELVARRLAALAHKYGEMDEGSTPFSEMAKAAGQSHEGGRRDDVTVLVAYVCEPESK